MGENSKGWKAKQVEQAIANYETKFSGEILDLIKQDLQDGLGTGRVAQYAQTENSYRRMKMWSYCLRSNFPNKIIKNIFKPEFTDEKCETLVKQYEKGVPEKDLLTSVEVESGQEHLRETEKHVAVEGDTVQESLRIHDGNKEFEQMKQLVEESVSASHAKEVIHAVGSAMGESGMTVNEEVAKLRADNRILQSEKKQIMREINAMREQAVQQGERVSAEAYKRIMEEKNNLTDDYLMKLNEAGKQLSEEKRVRNATEQELNFAQEKINSLDAANRKLEKEMKDMTENSRSGQETISDLKSQIAEEKRKEAAMQTELVKKDGVISALRGELKEAKQKAAAAPERKEVFLADSREKSGEKTEDFKYHHENTPRVTVQKESVHEKKEEPMYQKDYHAVVPTGNGPVVVAVERTRRKRGGLFGLIAGIMTGGKNKTFINELHGKEVTPEQLREIYRGIESGLDEEQVKALIDGNFQPEAIKQIIGIAMAIDNR